MLFAKLLPSADSVIERLLHDERGQLCVSILLGLGLASIFRRVCEDNQCRVLRAAPLANIKDKVFKLNDKCVKYVAYPVECKEPSKKVEQLVSS